MCYILVIQILKISVHEIRTLKRNTFVPRHIFSFSHEKYVHFVVEKTFIIVDNTTKVL